MDKHKITTFRIVRIAIFATILFVQEELLTSIPNVQFTQCLIAIYYYSFGLFDTICIVFIHTLLDNLILGSLNFIYTPAMLVGWLSLVLILHIFKKLSNKYVISTIVGLHGIIYSFCFLIANIITYKYEFIPYLISDLPFELILVVNGFITTFLLFNPLRNILIKLKNREIKSEVKEV